MSDPNIKPVLTKRMILEKELALVGMFLITLFATFKSERSRNKLYELLFNKFWLINIIIIIGFAIYTVYSSANINNVEDKRTILSLKRGLIALLISIFSELGFTIAPFWLVFIFSYFMEGWM